MVQVDVRGLTCPGAPGPTGRGGDDGDDTNPGAPRRQQPGPPDEHLVQRVLRNVEVVGPDGDGGRFREHVVADLHEISRTPTGRALLEHLATTPHANRIAHPDTHPILRMVGGDGACAMPSGDTRWGTACTEHDPHGPMSIAHTDSTGDHQTDAANNVVRSPGRYLGPNEHGGIGGTAYYRPDAPHSADSPSHTSLFHEGSHVQHMNEGNDLRNVGPRDDGWHRDWSNGEEFATVHAENHYRDEHGLPQRENYNHLPGVGRYDPASGEMRPE
jgi:hypothetical protein